MNSQGYEAVRNQTALIETDDYNFVLRVTGEDAREFLNAALPGKLAFLQPYASAIMPVLNAEIAIEDMVIVSALEDGYLVIGSKAAKPDVMRFLESQRRGQVAIEDLDAEWATCLVEGPYAWRIAKDLVAPEVIGLRYLGWMEFELGGSKAMCLRSGMTGEYGYRFLLPRSQKAALVTTIRSHGDFGGAAIDPVVDHDTLRVLCSETRTPAFGFTLQAGDSPFEAGIRYMLDLRKTEYVFFSALTEQSAAASLSLTAVISDATSESEAQVGRKIMRGDRAVGTLRSLQFSPTLKKSIGYVSLENDVAYPGLSDLTVEDGGAAVLSTVSTPFFTTISASVQME